MRDQARPLLLRGGLVIDGTGAPARHADLLVAGGRIAAIGGIGALPPGCETFDAAGLAVSPGFIDAHSHDDGAILSDEAMLPKIAQGVTTVVVGNCGIAFPPLLPGGVEGRAVPPPLNLLGGRANFAYGSHAAYLAELRSRLRPVDAVALCGHSALRVALCADWRRPASPAEIGAMRDSVAEAMRAGCAGLSSGLAYPTARAATGAETAALAAAAVAAAGERGAPGGAVLAIHLRDEYGGVWEALDEAFAIARDSGAFLVLSHQKVAGPGNRGRSGELLERITRASRAIPLALDCYPYEAGSTILEAASARQSRRVLVTWSEPRPELAGRSLEEAGAALGLDPRAELEALVEALSPAGAAYFHMDEADVEAILSHPLCMLGSDGLPNDRHPHPRLHGAFARFLGVYVRERRLVGLEEAVRKMTSLPAAVFGLADRGLLRAGARADIAVWDPARVADRANWEEPRRLAEGFELVLSAGRRTWADAEGERRSGAVGTAPKND